MLGVSATLDYRELTAWNHGVVTQDAIVLRSGPGESYDPSFEQRVDSGAEFVVVAERDDWVKALVGGKYEGWLSEEVVARW